MSFKFSNLIRSYKEFISMRHINQEISNHDEKFKFVIFSKIRLKIRLD
jgi:hypothetical protein